MDGPTDREYRDMARFYASLADPVRLRVLWLLAHADEAYTATDIAKELGRPVSTISRHVTVLMAQDIVTPEHQEGRRLYLGLAGPWVREELESTLAHVAPPPSSHRATLE